MSFIKKSIFGTFRDPCANANENTNTLMVRLGGLRPDCWLRNDTAAGATATTFLSLRDP